MAYVEHPAIWGFALDGALDSLLERFIEITAAGRSDWVLIPVHGATFDTLRVPEGFHAEEASA